jgi:hypothetical protein
MIGRPQKESALCKIAEGAFLLAGLAEAQLSRKIFPVASGDRTKRILGCAVGIDGFLALPVPEVGRDGERIGCDALLAPHAKKGDGAFCRAAAVDRTGRELGGVSTMILTGDELLVSTAVTTASGSS